MGGICSSSDDEAFTEEDLELLKHVRKEDKSRVTDALRSGGDPFCREPTLSSQGKKCYTGQDVKWGMTTVHITATNGNQEILDLLLRTSTGPSDLSKELCMLAENDQRLKGTSLEFAIDAGYPEMAAKLLEQGSPVADRAKGSGAPCQLISMAIRSLFSTKFVSSEQKNVNSASYLIVKLIEKKVELGEKLADYRNDKNQTLLHELVSAALIADPVGQKLNGADGPLAVVTKSLIQAGVDSAVQGADGKLAVALDHKGTFSDALVPAAGSVPPTV